MGEHKGRTCPDCSAFHFEATRWCADCVVRHSTICRQCRVWFDKDAENLLCRSCRNQIPLPGTEPAR